MEITKTLLINAACLLIPPVVVVLLLRHFFPRKIRWSAGVVALVDLVIFWTDISYYESVWLTLFFVVIQLAMVLLILSGFIKRHTKMNCPKIEAIHPKTVEPLGYFCNIWGLG